MGNSQQHQNYSETLRTIGLDVIEVPQANELPDACYIEDSAIIVDSTAILCNLGPGREGEQIGVGPILSQMGLKLVVMFPPAVAEGGDVLRIGRTFFVGISSRTNHKGFLFIKEVVNRLGYDAYPVTVTGALHLKTACTYLGRNTLVGSLELLGAGKEALESFNIIRPELDESHVANILTIGNVTLIPDGCPKAAERISSLGFKVRQVDISEHRKAEAGLTCMSIISSNAHNEQVQ